ncbi:hypothetical protein TruAng_001634 [Truncatella angustata]|nr:hypothetical protein TruAng_001634 [Truncatella angustata]
MQQTLNAALSVLSLADVPTGTVLIIFAQMFGGSLLVSVAQHVFTNKRVAGLGTISNLSIGPKAVNTAGATDIATLITDPVVLSEVKVVYNTAIMWTFRAALITTSLSVFGTLSKEWENVKSK